jgi:hypothetical protein
MREDRQRNQLTAFLTAIDARAKLVRDDADDLLIPAEYGVVYVDSNILRFHIVFGVPACAGIPRTLPLSPERARAIKQRLLFADLWQDCATELGFRLDRLPATANEAISIRAALNLPKRRHLSEAQRATAAARLAAFRPKPRG